MKRLIKSKIKFLLQPRKKNVHKGMFGHALIIAGNTGKMGAAVISAKACLRSGAGLTTICAPHGDKGILQVAAPEAMVIYREQADINFANYSAIGIGPAIGVNNDSVTLLNSIFKYYTKPILLDADALNCISVNPDLLDIIPENTIITPHPKEFDRLFGIHADVDMRIVTAIKKAAQHKIIIVLKNHETIITNGLETYINTTGNAGLAKGGSGDALTGIITSFLAQGYLPIDATKLGVYLHGSAADICLKKQSMESMLITDVIKCLGKAFKELEK